MTLPHHLTPKGVLKGLFSMALPATFERLSCFIERKQGLLPHFPLTPYALPREFSHGTPSPPYL